MTRTRPVLGIVGGAALILSSAAHSLLGWKSLSERLAPTGLPVDLVLALKIGWQFGGVAMLVFGIIAIRTFARRLTGSAESTYPALAIGVGYLAFGTWALAVSSDPFFFFIFIVPAALLLLAAAVREPAMSARQ